MPIGNTASRVRPCLRDRDIVGDRQRQRVAHIGDEIVAVVLGLEADQVVGQHRLDQLAMMRHALDDGSRRPRRVEEEADRLAHAEVAQLRAERQEVIVLHPERGVGLVEAQQRARHEGVDLAIAEIVALRDADQIAARMQRRPQRRIGEAFVIAAVMRGRQIEHRERALPERLDFGERLLLQAVAHPAGRADPDRAGVLDDRQQRSRQPAGHRLIGLATRYTIGNDDEVHRSPPDVRAV